MVIRNKRGWIRILEATIAVMIVSGVMVVVYSNHPNRSEGTEEFVFNLQKQLLMDIVSRSDLRGYVLTGDEDSLDRLDVYVGDRVPSAYGYYLKICNLTDPPTPCKMDLQTFKETKDKSLYVEEVVVSSDLGDGSGSPIYSPKKVVLFIWE